MFLNIGGVVPKTKCLRRKPTKKNNISNGFTSPSGMSRQDVTIAKSGSGPCIAHAPDTAGTMEGN